jgi:hypothetical protein
VLWICVACVALNVAWVAYIRLRQTKPPSPDLKSATAGRAKSAAQQRIDNATQTAGAADFDQLCDALDDYDPAYELALTASMSHASPTPPVVYVGVISDRRVARLFEILKNDRPEAAGRRAARLFDDKLRSAGERWQAAAPRNAMVDPTAMHAVAAALFLCAHFCDLQTLQQKATAWTEWFDSFEPKSGDFREYARPDWMFLTNCRLNGLERAGQSRDELNNRLRQLQAEFGLTLPELRPAWLFKWNAKTLPTDFTRMHQGAAVDWTAVLVELSAFPEQPLQGGPTYDYEAQAAVVNRVSAWLDEARPKSP